MKIPKWVVVVVALFMLLATSLMVMPVAAYDYACNFYGTAAVNGVPVAAGTEITAWLGVSQVASAVTGDGSLPDDVYSLDVVLDEAYDGATINFKIGTLWANETGTWKKMWFDPIEVNLTAEADTDPPTVVSTSPANGDTDVLIDAVVSATFSEDIQEGTNFGDIDIDGATGVSASITGDTLTIAHDDFAYDTTYEVTIPAGAVEDLAGNPLASDYTWSFTTEADDYPPEVESTSPDDGDTGVRITKEVKATFNEDIQEGANFDDIDIDGATDVSASIDGDTLTIAHDDFDYKTTYDVTIPAGAVEDLAGNPLAEEYTWSFRTKAKPATLLVEEVEEEEEVIVPSPELGPRVSVGNLRISPDQVSPNQAVTISISVYNAGDRGGSRTLNLLINDEFEQRTQVGVPAHGSKSVSFTVSRVNPGVYSVYIEGHSGWFTVLAAVESSEPEEAGLSTGALIAIVIIAIVLSVGITFAFLYIRRSA
jgi:hypothetical protein